MDFKLGVLVSTVLLWTTIHLDAQNVELKNSGKMKKIEIGDDAPHFILKDQNGKDFDMTGVLGKKKLVIFFYPKDDTPGCTKQACYFRDRYEDFVDSGAEVIGISGQSVESHRNFAEKYQLSYRILSDVDNRVRKLFGVPTSMFGLLPGRVTYIIDKSGKVVHIFNSQTDLQGHISESLKILSL